MESARRWSGYVCPACRFVFRVPRDHDGRGIVCPSCRRMLKIPTAADVPPPLMVPLRRTSSKEPEPEPESEKVGKRKRGRKKGENLAWESSSDSSGLRRGQRQQMKLWLIGGTTLLGLVVAGIGIAMNQVPKPAGNGQPINSALGGDEIPLIEASPQIPEVRADASILAEAEPLARRFLGATTVEEILPLVRDPELVGPRIRKFYPDGMIKAAGLSQFAPDGAVTSIGGLKAITVLTDNFETRSMGFTTTQGEMRIDWESWVGWSEMSWDDFLSTKPTEGHVFRVILSAVEYYNFDFNDDLKWQSYRLEDSDQSHSIYGYTEKSTILDKRVRPNVDTKFVPLMLSLKFPENARSDGQVEIESLVNESWVEEEPTK
jgi:hypothetical protein